MDKSAIDIWYLAINASLATAVMYFGRKWMNGVEKTAEKNRMELAKHTQQTNEDLKAMIRENRDEYKDKADSIIESLNKLSDHVAIANGRTSKNEVAITRLEGELHTQVTLCKARNAGAIHNNHGVQ
jgi:ABC-type lipoprotein release transport system permease subunit